MADEMGCLLVAYPSKHDSVSEEKRCRFRLTLQVSKETYP